MYKQKYLLSVLYSGLCTNIYTLQWHYTKQRAETIAAYRGYQTMDSRVHPQVVQGQKASDLISDVSYFRIKQI